MVHRRTARARRFRTALAVVSLTGYWAVVTQAVVMPAAPFGTPSRVRSSNGAILTLIQEGTGRSRTFRSLVDFIDQPNGIVYVEYGFCSFGHLNGCLLPFMASTRGDRYLRVTVTPDKIRVNHDQLLALIGHELQYAREVIEHQDVVDVLTMEAMYREIGTPIPGGARGFETSAARAAGDAVARELLHAAHDWDDRTLTLDQHRFDESPFTSGRQAVKIRLDRLNEEGDADEKISQ